MLPISVSSTFLHTDKQAHCLDFIVNSSCSKWSVDKSNCFYLYKVAKVQFFLLFASTKSLLCALLTLASVTATFTFLDFYCHKITVIIFHVTALTFSPPPPPLITTQESNISYLPRISTFHRRLCPFFFLPAHCA